MSIHRFISAASLFFVSLLLFSCAARITGSLSADGSAVLSVNMSLEPRITALIRSLTSAAGQTDAPVLDGNAITESMSSAPGIASVSFRNTTPSAIEGTVRISSINEFLSAADNENPQNRFIVFEQRRLELNINRENGSVILELLSPEIADYLNALMAPVATGEELDKSEYLELVASFYNKAISDEIAGSRIRVSIEFPGSITSVRGGTFSGRRADFDIPLLDLLVLETPVVFQVEWR